MVLRRRVCTAIAVINHRDAVSKLDDDEKGVASTDTLSGRQKMTIISESGLYTLILRCRDAVKQGTLPYRFRKWVTNEVLPQIRKTGSYSHQQLFNPIHPVDYANRIELIYHQDYKAIFCRTLQPGEVVITHESMMDWLRCQGMVFFTREELKNMRLSDILAIAG